MLLLALTVLIWTGQSPAFAKTADERLRLAQERIDNAKMRGGALTKDVERFGDRISVLEGEVADIRVRESAAEAELAIQQARLVQAVNQLERAEARLRIERKRLGRALDNLRFRLASMYMSGTTDIASIALASKDFGELVTARNYLEAVQNQSEDLAERIRSIRNRARKNVNLRLESKLTVEDSRDAIAAEEVRLEDARYTLEAREENLVKARVEREHLLGNVRNDIARGEEIAADIRAEIEATIAEATAPTAIPASPESAPSSSGLIWPVDGVLTSAFGPRWGSSHEGIDISAAEGTPIRAAASGTVILLQPEASSGGYGNYTCLDHKNGLSTCYAHQSAFNTTSGASVAQGEIVGYVGNTGHSFGAHLHFEVRIGGVAADPLSYL